MRQEEQRRLTEALERFCMYCERKGLQKMLERARELYGQARLGLEPEGLEQISNLMKAAVGYDPQEGDTSQKREKLSASQESEAREVPSLQDLRRRIYVTAKAEPSKRFWGLMRARGRKGFGWKRWSNGWIYRTLGLFDGYRVRWTA